MPTFFISDLHLDASQPHLLQAFEAFLQRIQGQCQALYVLGDLFEAWIGDDDPSELGQRVAASLAQCALHGSAVYLMHGNRDFLLGEAFAERCSATLLPDPTVIELYGTATLLMHGDSLCTQDIDYIKFRSYIRQAQITQDLLSKSLEERRALAGALRQQSGEAMSNKAEDIMDVTPAAVEQCMEEHGVTRLIHGHTHRPGRHQHAAGERLVLGDWGEKLWFIAADESSLRLASQDIALSGV